MPYTIFAPLFLDSTSVGFLSQQWPLAMRSIFLGATLAVYPLGQFIGSPILGALSDQLGRKRLLLFSMLGAAVCYLACGLSIYGHTGVVA